jgi:hypothetical protein
MRVGYGPDSSFVRQLLRGYPIGSFLFWNVAPEALKFTFHQSLRHYHENREPICTQHDSHLDKA